MNIDINNIASYIIELFSFILSKKRLDIGSQVDQNIPYNHSNKILLFNNKYKL